MAGGRPSPPGLPPLNARHKLSRSHAQNFRKVNRQNHHPTRRPRDRTFFVDELKQGAEPRLNDGGSLVLDLTDVTFADEGGTAFPHQPARPGSKIAPGNALRRRAIKNQRACLQR